ncbi:hypothetical protein HanRHA438_Chr08g0346991 [Helianthus annuus]|nr:hypothetical protein HanRHA438_Chr08g0346991 [Helianthus annuus]
MAEANRPITFPAKWRKPTGRRFNSKSTPDAVSEPETSFTWSNSSHHRHLFWRQQLPEIKSKHHPRFEKLSMNVSRSA